MLGRHHEKRQCGLPAVVGAVACALLLPTSAGALPVGKTRLLSINSGGTASGDGGALGGPRISADGRFVVFTSLATNLTGVTDTNGATGDVFVRDLKTGVTTPVSMNVAGTATANGESANAFISANGCCVVFESDATDLITGFTDNNTTNFDVFVRDLSTGTTRLVSAKAGDPTASGNDYSQDASISADGQRIAFEGQASDLVSGATDSNAVSDVFVRDLGSNTTSLVSAKNGDPATAGADASISAAISANGQFVAFLSSASDVVGTDTNGGTAADDVFRRDLQAGSTALASVNASGTDSGDKGGTSTDGLTISADGRYVAFQSNSTNVVSGFVDNDGASAQDIFRRDFGTGTTALVSGKSGSSATDTGNANSSAQAMTPDGRFISFSSQATDLTTTTGGGGPQTFRRDMQAGSTALVSFNSLGTAPANGGSGSPAISDDGRFVTFISFGTDLTSLMDSNSAGDIFRRDLGAGTTSMISTNAAGTAAGNATSTIDGKPVVSADGRFVAFASRATDLVSPFTDGNAGTADVFARGDFQPTASFTATPASGSAPLAVGVDGSGSSDPDGSIASYGWDFGDGGTASGATASHSYASAGTFTVTLTVTDDDGDTAQAQRTLTVSSGSATIGKTVLNKRNGTATLTVDVNGPGTVALGGNGIVAQQVAATARAKDAASRVKLTVRSRGKKKSTLNRAGKVQVTATVTYTPTGGAPSSQSRKIKLIKRL